MAEQNNRVTSDELEGRGEMDQPGMITPRRLADYWGVSIDTVYRDLRKGALRGFRLPGGYIRIRIRDAKKYGRPIE